MLPPPTREAVSVDAIPVRPIRDIARDAVADIDVSLAKLEVFGVSIPMSSRLHAARAILEDASHSGMLAPMHRGDTLGLRALETGLDFHDIVTSLPSDKDSAVRKDIERALAGELDPGETSRGPLQLQSQLVIRAAFVQGGADLVRAEKPRPGRPQPDVVLANGSMHHAIEVKRPQTAKNVHSRFEEAVDQLKRFGGLGGIIVDVTDCVRGLTGEQLDLAIREHAVSMYDLAFHDGAYLPGYDHIIMIGTVARPAWTSTDSSTRALVNVHSSTTVGVLARSRNNLAGYRARWLRQVLQTGLRRLGMTSAEF